MTPASYPISSFKDEQWFFPELRDAVAAAQLPELLAIDSEDRTVRLWFDLPLDARQRAALDGIVAKADAPAAELVVAKANLGGLVTTQATGRKEDEAATLAAIDAASTIDDATAIAEKYLGRPIE